MTTTYLVRPLDVCETTGIHHETIKKVRSKLPDCNKLDIIADFFKSFSDSTRIRILWALSEAELCVCDLCALLKILKQLAS